MKRIIAVLITAAVVFAQTTGTASRTNDNTFVVGTIQTILGSLIAGSATETLPCRKGSGAPTGQNGTVGDCYYNTAGTAGQNLWWATATGTPATWTLQAGSSGGASITRTVVTYSATPVYTRSSQIQEWELPLTGNVTSSTTSGLVAADILIFKLCQDGTGGRTHVWPTGFSEAASIALTISACTKETFYWDGSAARLLSAIVDSGPDVIPESAAPSGSPASGFQYQWNDSTDHVFEVKDSSGNVYKMVRTGGDFTFPSTVSKVNGIAMSGTPAIGYVPTATSTSAATWQAPTGLSAFLDNQGRTSAITMTGSNVPIYTTSIAGGTMAAGKCLWVDLTSSLNVAGTSTTYGVQYGATTYGFIVASTGAGDTNAINLRFSICNNAGVTNAQTLNIYNAFNSGIALTTISLIPVAFATENSTTTLNLIYYANSAGSTVRGSQWHVTVDR